MPIKQHKFLTQDINGNWVYVDINNRRIEAAAPQQGTIQRNANREVRKARSAQRYKAQQKNKEQARFAKQYNSHQETSSMVRTKQASPEEVDYGRTDKYDIIPDHKVIGMSGADPVGQFAVEMAALDMPFRLAGKTAMYGLGRYGENLGVENLSKWARNRLVANEFRNSTLGNVKQVTKPTVTLMAPSQIKREPMTSLKFFERPQSKISKTSIKGSREPKMAWNPETGDFMIIPIPEVFERELKKVPQRLIRDPKLTYGETSDLAQIEKSGFIPKASMDIGPFNRLYAQETINRLKELGYDVKNVIPIKTKGFRNLRTPENFIRENVENPIYLGYYTKDSNIMGSFYPMYDKSVVDPTLAKNIPSVALHERNMHGTDALIQGYEDIGQPLAKDMYQNFLNKLFYKKEGTGDVQIITPKNKVSISDDGKTMIDFSGTKYPMLEGTDQWYEGRSTINELKRKYLYKIWKQYGKPKALESVREQYKKHIDNMPENILLSDLDKINGYGQTYVNLKDNNPAFIPDLKKLLKYGAVYSVPITIGGYTLSKKQGGKMYKFKKGNKIHIKESQKGSFTKYCKGKVTEECIQKGKNSPNPKIRKKATFAANVRKWKHQEGGNIISSEGVDALAGIAGNLFGRISANKAIKKKRNAINAQSAYAKNAARSQVMGQAQESENQKAVQQLQQFNENSDNGRPSEIVSQTNAYNNAMKILPSYYNQIDQETNAQLAELKALKQQNTANMINGIFSAGIQYGQDSGLFDKWNQKWLVKQFEKNAKNNLNNIKINNNAPKISTGNIGLV